MLKVYTALFLIIFSSCRARLDCLGNSYTPSKHVEVFVDASAIKKSLHYNGQGLHGV